MRVSYSFQILLASFIIGLTLRKQRKIKVPKQPKYKNIMIKNFNIKLEMVSYKRKSKTTFKKNSKANIFCISKHPKVKHYKANIFVFQSILK